LAQATTSLVYFLARLSGQAARDTREREREKGREGGREGEREERRARARERTSETEKTIYGHYR